MLPSQAVDFFTTLVYFPKQILKYSINVQPIDPDFTDTYLFITK